MKSLARLLAAALVSGAAAAPAAEVAFDTQVVEPQSLDKIRSAPGTIESRQEARISAEVSGRVEALPYDAGDKVEKGTVLVRLDDSDLRSQLNVARAALDAAEAHVQQAQQEFDRTKRLYEQESASEQQMDQATAALKRAKAQQSKAEAEIRTLRIRLDKTTIKAPFNGVVVTQHIEEGELAQPGSALLTVLDPERLRLTARVQESRIPELMSNGKARVWVPALEQRFEAQRVTVVPQGDRRTHTFQVRLRLPQSAPASAGMFGRAEFLLGETQTLVVPPEAVVRRSEITGVYVVDDSDRVSLRLVELGEPSNEGHEVLAGLSAGERVALEPEKALRYLKQHQSRPESSGGTP